MRLVSQERWFIAIVAMMCAAPAGQAEMTRSHCELSNNQYVQTQPCPVVAPRERR